MNKKLKKTLIIGLPLFFILVLITVSLLYLCTYYKAVDCESYLESNATVSVSENKDYIFFDGVGTDNAFIFYPGGKVDEKAYAQLMYSLASVGVDCYLVKMPCHLAIFGSNKASEIIDGTYKNYYIGGHSLGGVMASNYVSKSDDIKGLILLAAYTNKDISDKNIKCLSVYGTDDGVLNMKNYNKYKDYLPSGYTEQVIAGGNHANFASYGYQKGDGETKLTRNEQIYLTLYYIYDLVTGE